MFDEVPVRIWLLIAIAAFAYSPVRYVYQHLVHSPSRRDITRPAEDLSWRTSSHLIRNLSILAAGLGVAVFIFTPAAEEFARSPRFLPILMICLGAWTLFTVPRGLVTGHVQPLMKGFQNTYERETQPKRFWASLAWNAAFGLVFIWLAYQTDREASAQLAHDLCYDEKNANPPQDALTACNQLIGDADNSRDEIAGLIGARGVAFHRLGNHRQAISDYSEAIRLDPRDSYSHFNRGLIYQNLGDHRRAIADYSEAIRLRPTDPDARLHRGIVFLDTGQFDEAVADFTRAHELAPKDPWPLANRGIAYASQRAASLAEADFSAVRAFDPSNPVLLRGEALLSLNAGDTKTAVNRLTAALSQEPDNVWALTVRAKAYWELGEYEKSQADTDRLLQLTKAPNEALLPRD